MRAVNVPAVAVILGDKELKTRNLITIYAKVTIPSQVRLNT